MMLSMSPAFLLSGKDGMILLLVILVSKNQNSISLRENKYSIILQCEYIKLEFILQPYDMCNGRAPG